MESFITFITTSLKGISQVILIENAITGLLILIAITIESYYLGIIALLSAIIGTLVGKFGGADEQTINQGLLGYNSVLTGMALALFLSGPYMWIVALVGAAIAAIFTATMMHFMQKTEIPILTFPFIILTWFILLSSYKLKMIKLSPDIRTSRFNKLGIRYCRRDRFIKRIFNGIGQVFFLDNTISGILILLLSFGWEKAGILCSYRKYSCYHHCLFFRRGTYLNRVRGFMDITQF